jgi:1,2-diacylglycerol 3-alpha-glucosyltransferase
LNSLTSTILDEMARAGIPLSDKLRAELESRLNTRLEPWWRDETTPREDELEDSSFYNDPGDDDDGPELEEGGPDDGIAQPYEKRPFDRERLRIGLMCDTYLPFSNGVTHMVALLARTLADWGHEPHIFTIAAPGLSRVPLHDHEGIRVHRAPGLPISRSGYHFAMRYPLRMRWLMREMDVLHVHHPFISGRIAWRLKDANQPLLFTNHTRYDIYGHYVQRVMPFVPEDMVRERLIYRATRFANRCDTVISPSASVAQVLSEWGVQAPIETIPNGISLDRFYDARAACTTAKRNEFRARFEWQSDAKVLVFLGRLVPEKNIETLLEAFSALRHSVPKAHLLLLGEGPSEGELRAVARQLRLGNAVHFAGALPYEEVPNALAACDLFTSASVSEVHPLTFIEAMACGLTAIGTRSPGVADTLRDETDCTSEKPIPNGWLCEPTPESLSAAMVEALTNEVEQKRRAVQAKRDSADYSIETTAHHTIELYHRALASLAT